MRVLGARVHPIHTTFCLRAAQWYSTADTHTLTRSSLAAHAPLAKPSGAMRRTLSTLVVLSLAFAGSRASSPVGVTYTDWDGALTCKPMYFAMPASEAEISSLVSSAAAEGRTGVS